MTWDVLGGRVQRKIFSTFYKVHRATDLLLLAFPHGFPRRGFGVAATAQLVVNCAFALSGLAKKPNLGHNTHAPLKVLCNPYHSSFHVLEIPSTKAGAHPLKKKKKSHFDELAFTQQKFCYQNPPAISTKIWVPAELPPWHTCIHMCVQMYINPCRFHKKLVLNSSFGWREGTLIDSYLPHCWKVEFAECLVWSLPPSTWRCRVCRNMKGKKKKRQVIPRGVIGQQCLDSSQKIRGREESTE